MGECPSPLHPLPEIANVPVSLIWGFFRMVLIAVLQLNYLWKGNSTNALGSIYELLAFLVHGNIQGLQFQEKDGFGNPSGLPNQE